MAQQFLHSANIIARFEKMGGIAVTKGVRSSSSGYLRLYSCRLDRLLYMRFMKVIATVKRGPWDQRQLFRLEKELPGEFFG